LNDNLYALRRDGTVSKYSGTWGAFGDAGSDTSWVSISAWSTYVFALRNDGTVQRSPTGSADWTTFIGDAGTDTCWESIAAADDSTLYVLRLDGYIGKYDGSWTNPGDVSTETDYVGIACPIDEFVSVLVPILVGIFIVRSMRCKKYGG
jgi:hypothetical protein